MARVLKFVDVCPDFSLPALFVRGRFAAGGASRVKGGRWSFSFQRDGARKFDEDAAYFLNLFVLAEEVLVAQQVSKAEFPGLSLGLGAGVKWSALARAAIGCRHGWPHTSRQLQTAPDTKLVEGAAQVVLDDLFGGADDLADFAIGHSLPD